MTITMTPKDKVRVSITASHDGGNIELVSISPPCLSSSRTASVTVSLKILPDVPTELESITHMQYFSFRSFLSGLTNNNNNNNDDDDDDNNDDNDNDIKVLSIRYILLNAHAASYPQAWPGSTISYTTGSLDASDDHLWKRNTTTTYIDGTLQWTHLHTTNGSTFFSYYPPYTHDRHLKLISDASTAFRSPHLTPYNPQLESLGQTLQHRQMECLSLGSGPLTGWIIHRQHPGETMAEFFAEGFLHRLLSNPPSNLLSRYRLHIVPCMCPDGAALGHLRTNSVGANLNREWATVHPTYPAPSSNSPEVKAVLARMDSTGCDFFLDVHGDEELPYVFFSGAEGTPAWGERMERLHGCFVGCYRRANSDVQREIGYPPPKGRTAEGYMNVATNQISNRFDCLGLTLEMPFKDCATNPDVEVGFGPMRAKQLGRNLVEALEGIAPFLRAEGEFWGEFGEDERYVVPTDDYKEEGFVKLKNRLYSDVRPQDG